MTHQFCDTDWDSIASIISTTYRLSADESRAFSQNKTAKLIASIPFIAGCDEPERTALAHLSVYQMARLGGRKIFDHSAEDNRDIYARLRLIMSFKGGNEKIIEKGMTLLARVMVAGYKRDQEKDQKAGEYNPLNDGAWDYANTTATLEKDSEILTESSFKGILSEADIVGAIW